MGKRVLIIFVITALLALHILTTAWEDLTREYPCRDYPCEPVPTVVESSYCPIERGVKS